MDKPSQHLDQDPLAGRLKEDAGKLVEIPEDSLVQLQERTLAVFRKEFPIKEAEVVGIRPNYLWPLAAAATIALVAGLVFHRPAPKTPVQPPPDTAMIPEGIQALADITSPDLALDKVEPFLTAPITAELDAMIQEFEATWFGILDLVQPT